MVTQYNNNDNSNNNNNNKKNNTNNGGDDNNNNNNNDNNNNNNNNNDNNSDTISWKLEKKQTVLCLLMVLRLAFKCISCAVIKALTISTIQVRDEYYISLSLQHSIPCRERLKLGINVPTSSSNQERRLHPGGTAILRYQDSLCSQENLPVFVTEIM